MDESSPSSSGHERNDAQGEPSSHSVTIRAISVPRNVHRASLEPSAPSARGGMRRKSSVAEMFGSLADRGGVNSFNNFARSWQRAAEFLEITQARPSFVLHSDSDNGNDEAEESLDVERAHRPFGSLRRAALEHEGRKASDVAVAEHDGDDGPNIPETISSFSRSSEAPRSYSQDSIFQLDPALGSPLGGSFRTHYGSLASRVNDSSQRHAGRMYIRQQNLGTSHPDKEREPLLVKAQKTDEGEYFHVVVGQSTLPQTIFNSVNVLIGVGMLALPLGIKYSGMLIGISFFVFVTVATSYTAKLLAKCLDVDCSLLTFADLAFVSFGRTARVGVSILFTLELLGACVALLILFADSLNALIPAWGVTEWKIVCGIILLPLGFVPLRFLSFTSILGIICCMSIIVAVFVDGIIKPHSPGSLREPAAMYLFPKDWRTLPLAFGLLMAPWGGHGVFPNIYRDMRHPTKYTRGVNITYIFTFVLELALAVIGYIMFGEGVLDEITSNIFLTKGYPRWISIVIVVAIAIIPITKLPLNSRPIISTLDVLCGLDARSMPSQGSMAGMTGFTRGLLKLIIRILTPVAFVIIAILVPSFDRVMCLLGSFACFTVCIVLPCTFHLRLYGHEMTVKQKILDWTLLIVCLVLAVIGTVCSFLPKKLLGAE